MLLQCCTKLAAIDCLWLNNLSNILTCNHDLYFW